MQASYFLEMKLVFDRLIEMMFLIKIQLLMVCKLSHAAHTAFRGVISAHVPRLLTLQSLLCFVLTASVSR